MTSPTLPDFVPDTIVAAATASKAPDVDKITRIAHARDYPVRAWICIIAFLACVSICHFSTLAYHLTRRSRATQTTPTKESRTISIYRLPLALANAFKALAFRTSVPIGRSYVLNPAEMFVPAAYIALIFSWSLANTTSTKGLRFDPRYYANMAGNLAALQLPLIAALGTKNNIISLLTGVSYNKLNYLHRMASRAVCVLIWVHASGRIKIGMTGSLTFDHPWVRCGVLAATSLTVLSVVSVRPLRNRHYEVFLIVHFLFVFIILLGGYFHAQGIQAGFHVWPTFIVWGLDRLIRGIRIIVNNFGYFRKGSIEQFGRIEVLSKQFVRVTIRRSTHVHWLPGQNVYLTVPELSPFQAHPFSISTIDVTHQESQYPDSTKEEEVSSSCSENGPAQYKELVFIAQVKKGFTKRLLAIAERDQTTKIIMDGPYSSPPLLRGFETVVLIAGGSGVTFTLPLMLDILRREKSKKNDCKRVCFIWAIRDIRHIEWIAAAVLPTLSAARPGLSIDFRVHVTAAIEDNQSWADDSAEGDEEVKIGFADYTQNKYPGISFERGRPDLKRIVNDEIGKTAGSLSFNVCGPAALAYAARSALKAPRFFDVLRGGPTVDLHVESFKM